MKNFKPFAITPTHVCDMTPDCPMCRMEKGLTEAEKWELWAQRRAVEAAVRREKL